MTIPPKISNFKEKFLFFRSLWRNCFFIYVQKYQHFEENDVFLRSLWKIVFFAHSTENINISRKRKFLSDRFLTISPKIPKFKKSYSSLDLFEQIVFWPYVPKYQHFEKSDVILRSLWQSSFYLKYDNIDISRKCKRKFLWDHFKKIVFSQYLQKYQNPKISNQVVKVADKDGLVSVLLNRWMRI